MEEHKNHNKVSRLIIILVIAVTVIIAILAYLMISQKSAADKEIAALKASEAELQATVSELQGKLGSISDIASTSNSTVSNDKEFTEEEVKECLSNYLELSAHAGCDALLECLTEKGDINYDSSKDKTNSDGTHITNVKFSDYKNAMLKYVSEDEYEKKWSKGDHYSENDEGYIVKYEGGGGLRVYTIKSISKKDDLTYTAKTSSVVDEEYYEENDYTFTIKNSNGRCVIDSISE